MDIEQIFASLKVVEEEPEIMEGAVKFCEHPLSLKSKDVEQKVVEGSAEFWDYAWEPIAKEANQIFKNWKRLDFSVFLGFLDYKYLFPMWCDQCRKKVFNMNQDELIKIDEGYTYKYKFSVCNDCAPIIEYVNSYY
uniref:DUF1033 family protein n=1 Tax=Meloidogyne hapla TaxID=6305 RepID=A0A1I8BGU0_MELHA